MQVTGVVELVGSVPKRQVVGEQHPLGVPHLACVTADIDQTVHPPRR